MKVSSKVLDRKGKQMSEVKYPKVKVKLVGEDGNAFAIMGRVVKALKSAGVSAEEVAQYQQESMSGDYDNLIATACRWVKVS
jgi:hypothetical protein